MEAFSFAEVVNERDSSVRMSPDGLLYAVDLVMVMTGRDRNYSGQVLRRLDEEEFDETKLQKRQLHGGLQTKLISFEDAIELVMVLPGKRATRFRKQCKEIISRYLDGDRSMCSEIFENQSMGKIKSYTKFSNKLINTVNKDAAKQKHEMPQTNYVYAMKSPAFPGFIKIGKTQHVKQRLSQLNVSCAPAPHVVVAVAPSFDQSRDEKTAHAFFSDKRREGEFFELDDAEVVAFFATHITAQYNVELMQNIARMQGSTVDE